MVQGCLFLPTVSRIKLIIVTFFFKRGLLVVVLWAVDVVIDYVYRVYAEIYF